MTTFPIKKTNKEQLASDRNISRASGCLLEAHGTGKLTTATSLGDLTSVGAWDHRKTLSNKRTSASVGNLTALSPMDLRDKTAHSISKLGSRVSPGPWSGRGGEVIVAAPVRERKGSHRIFSSHSIEEEVDEEEISLCEAVSRTPSCSTPQSTTQATFKSSKPTQNTEASSSRHAWCATNTNSRTTTASQTVQVPPTNDCPSRLGRGTSA